MVVRTRTVSSIILSKCEVHVPEEIVRHVHSFVMWDVCTMEFARHLSSKVCQRKIREFIHACMSRKNGFHKQEIFDSENEHWAFGDGDEVILQAINCSRCGKYIHAHTKGLPGRLKCQC